MKIVHIAPFSPFPTHFGGAMRTEALWRALASAGEVQFVVLGDKPSLEARRQLRAKGAWVYPSRRESKTQRFIRCVRAGLTRRCIPAARYLSPKRIDKLAERIQGWGPDVIVVDDTYLSVLIPALMSPNVRIVAHCHNVESQVHRRVAAHNRALAGRLVNYVLYRNTLAVERRYQRLADQVWTVSEDDADYCRRRLRLKSVFAIPCCLDLDRYQATDEQEAGAIVYTGFFGYWPNEDAAVRLIALSRQLRAEGTPHRLYLVGRDPTDRMLAAAAGVEDVCVTGEVLDVRPYLAKAAVVAVPLAAGGGTKLKVLEAMAMGKAIVTSPIGAEGMDIVSGVHAEIVPLSEFSEAITRLLRDGSHRRALGGAGRQWVQQHRDMPVMQRRVRELLANLLSGDRPTVGSGSG